MRRRRQSTAQPFSPSSIAGLSLWLKGDAGVTEAGGFVTDWADQSGQDNDFTSGQSIVLNTSGDLPYLEFPSGEDASIISPNGLLGGFTGLSFFAVWNVTNVPNGGVFGSSNYNNFEVTSQDNSVVRLRNGDTASNIIDSGFWNDQEWGYSSLTAQDYYISQIVITGCNPSSSNGTYTRASGGTTTFNGPDNNTIYYAGDWYLYDDNLADDTFTSLDNLQNWIVNNGTSFGSATNTFVGSPMYASLNGTEIDYSPLNVSFPLQTGQDYAIGQYAQSAGNFYNPMSLAELIIYDNQLSTLEVGQIESYLVDRWGFLL